MPGQTSRRARGIATCSRSRATQPWRDCWASITAPMPRTLLRRRNDWMILAHDGQRAAQLGAVRHDRSKPQGPYSERKLVRNVEADYFHPPLMEFYPAFADAGWVYAPATSVARNRNFQIIFRAPLEKRGRARGLGNLSPRFGVAQRRPAQRGATASGGRRSQAAWIGTSVLWAMFPSRNAAGFGTINLAPRPWAKPLRAWGFHLSGHQAPSLTCLRRSYADFTLDAELRLRGTARIFWSYQAPLGPDRPTSDATLHPLSLTRHQGARVDTGRLESNRRRRQRNGKRSWRPGPLRPRGHGKSSSGGARRGRWPWRLTARKCGGGSSRRRWCVGPAGAASHSPFRRSFRARRPASAHRTFIAAHGGLARRRGESGELGRAKTRRSALAWGQCAARRRARQVELHGTGFQTLVPAKSWFSYKS